MLPLLVFVVRRRNPYRFLRAMSRILDMCRTATNITSDSSITMVVAHTEGEVDDTVLFGG